jgi:hypothetical protein
MRKDGDHKIRDERREKLGDDQQFLVIISLIKLILLKIRVRNVKF